MSASAYRTPRTSKETRDLYKFRDQLNRVIVYNSIPEASKGRFLYVAKDGTVSSQKRGQMQKNMKMLLEKSEFPKFYSSFYTNEFKKMLTDLDIEVDFGNAEEVDAKDVREYYSTHSSSGFNITPSIEYIKKNPVRDGQVYSIDSSPLPLSPDFFDSEEEGAKSKKRKVVESPPTTASIHTISDDSQNTSRSEENTSRSEDTPSQTPSISQVTSPVNPELTLSKNTELETLNQESIVQQIVQQRADYEQAKSDMREGKPVDDDKLNPPTIETPVVGQEKTTQLSDRDIATQAESVHSSLELENMYDIPATQVRPEDFYLLSPMQQRVYRRIMPQDYFDELNEIYSLNPIGGASQAKPETVSETDQAPQTSTQAAQVQEPYMNKFHKSQVILFLGNPPVFDTDLDNNLDSLSLSKSEVNEMMDNVISASGQKILVSKRLSDGNKEELRVLLQLHFCVLRNLQRGPRQKMAMVPLSSLVDLAGSAKSNQLTQTQSQDPFVEAANMPTQPQLNTTSSSSVMQNSAVQKSVERKVQIDDTVNAYRKREYTKSGKVHTKFTEEAKHSIQSQNQLDIIGSSSSNDPLGEKYLTSKNPIRPNQVRYKNIV